MTKKMLIVEDSTYQAEVLSDKLSEVGYKTTIALNGKEALAKLTKDTDIVILDTMLPDIDGFELCKKIKDAGPNELIIIMTTATADAIDVSKAKESGADDYAVKTGDLQHLIDVVGKYA